MDRSKQIPPLVEKGLSRYQIASEVGVSPGTVAYWIKKLGLKTRNPPPGERPPKRDLTGMRFGAQTVVRMERTAEGRWMAICRCDCGSDDRVLEPASLRRGRSTSCGCRRDHYSKITGQNSTNYTGHEGLPGKHWKKIRARARRFGGIKFKIDDAWALYQEQEGRCALTGLKIEFGRAEHRDETTASLDRIDSSIGYELDNVQWVHKRVNLMKGTLTTGEFIRFCQLVVESADDSIPQR